MSDKIRKVHLNTFIDILIELYNKGVDYIDIINVSTSEKQDGIGISFCKEYMNKELIDNFDIIPTIKDKEEQPEPETKDKKLTDDDVNQLL